VSPAGRFPGRRGRRDLGPGAVEIGLGLGRGGGGRRGRGGGDDGGKGGNERDLGAVCLYFVFEFLEKLIDD
jgi:hypothetical protein